MVLDLPDVISLASADRSFSKKKPKIVEIIITKKINQKTNSNRLVVLVNRLFGFIDLALVSQEAQQCQQHPPHQRQQLM